MSDAPGVLLRGACVVLRHVLRAGLVFVVVTAVAYWAIHRSVTNDPGDLADLCTNCTPADEAAVRDAADLDESTLGGYAAWLGRAITGDLGENVSQATSRDSGEEPLQSPGSVLWRWLIDVQVAAYGSVVAVVVGFGLASSRFRRSANAAAVGQVVWAIPAIALALLLIDRVLRDRSDRGGSTGLWFVGWVPWGDIDSLGAFGEHLARAAIPSLALGLSAGAGLFLKLRRPWAVGGIRAATRSSLQMAPWAFPLLLSSAMVIGRLVVTGGVGAGSFTSWIDPADFMALIAVAAAIGVVVLATSGAAGELLASPAPGGAGDAVLPEGSGPELAHPGGTRTAWLVGASCWLGVLVLFGVIAGDIRPHDPLQHHLLVGAQGPSPGHLLGTDLLGRDIFSCLLDGAGRVVVDTVVPVVVSTFAGAVLVVAAGRLGRGCRAVVRLLVDAGTVVTPLVVIGLAVSIGLVDSQGVRATPLRLAVALVTTPYVVCRLAERGWLRGPLRDSVRAVVGSSASVAAIVVGLMVLVDYIGYGATQTTEASWGQMLSESPQYLGNDSVGVYGIAAALTLTVLSLRVLGRWALGPPADLLDAAAAANRGAPAGRVESGPGGAPPKS